MIAFDSVEKVQAWENSKAYEAIAPLRHKSATGYAESASVLEAYLAEGKSTRTCAQQEFGTAYSRNSVIGRATRLGMHIASGSVPRTVEPTPRRVILRTVPPVAPANVDPVPFLQLRSFHCRAILDRRGDDGLALFCGAGRAAGSAYCGFHHDRFVSHA